MSKTVTYASPSNCTTVCAKRMYKTLECVSFLQPSTAQRMLGDKNKTKNKTVITVLLTTTVVTYVGPNVYCVANSVIDEPN